MNRAWPSVLLPDPNARQPLSTINGTKMADRKTPGAKLPSSQWMGGTSTRMASREHSHSARRHRARPMGIATLVVTILCHGAAASFAQTPPPAQQPYPGQPPAQQPYPGQPPAQQPYPGQAPAQQPYPGQAPPAQQPYPGQAPPPQQPYPAPQPAPYPGGPPPGAPTTPPPPAPYPPSGPPPPYPPAPEPSPEPTPIPTEELPEAGHGLTPTRGRYYSMPPEYQHRLDRRGLAVQIGLGAGGLFDEEDGNFGLGYNIAVGGVLTPSLAVLFEYQSLTFGTGGESRATHAVFGGIFNVFLTDIFWLKVGAGLGQLSLKDNWGFSFNATERAFAGIAGLGVEVYQLQPDFAIDLSLRAGGGKYSQAGWLINGMVMVGINFY